MKFIPRSLLLMGLLPVVVMAADAISLDRQKELRHLLIQDCGSCHGLQLKGGLGPALLPQNLVNKPDNFLAATILNGRPGTAMPPWRELLKPEEAMWIAQRLLTGELL